jgi:hypothetical protein
MRCSGVRWSSEDDLAGARGAVFRAHEEADFRPVEFVERDGIEAHLALSVEAEQAESDAVPAEAAGATSHAAPGA